MTYKVLKSLVYGGIAYAEGQEVDIIEKSVAENCLERELIAEITDTETGNAEVDRTGETDSTEITENNEDATEEVVSSEENTETEETESNEEEEKPEKTGKRNRNNK